MRFEPTKISDVLLARLDVLEEPNRRYHEGWTAHAFAAAGLEARFVQVNHTHSLRHTIRGLHYQVRPTQGRLIQVISGAVFDVAVDVRRSSPNFGRWVGLTLSAQDHHALWIPPGFAHGSLALSDFADTVCYCTQYWAPDSECAIAWNDADLGITWPLPSSKCPVLSARDAAARPFHEAQYLP